VIHGVDPSTGIVTGNQPHDMTYDQANNVLRQELAGAIVRSTNPLGQSVTYGFNNAGRQSTIANALAETTTTTTCYPDGSEVNRTYTARGQLQTIALGTTTIDTRVYDNGGRMTSSSYNNGVIESRTYQTDNTLATIT